MAVQYVKLSADVVLDQRSLHQQLRPIRARPHQHLNFTGLEHRRQVQPRETEIAAGTVRRTVLVSPGRNVTLPTPFSSSTGRVTVATLSW